MKKRLLSILLSLMLILGLMSGMSLTALAVNDGVASITDGTTVNYYNTIGEATGAWWSMGGGTTLTLLADVETTDCVIFNGGTADNPKIFDLNGHGILNNGNSEGGSPVLYVMNNTFIEIKDSAPAATHYVSLDNTGRATAVSNSSSDGAIEVSGGYIAGGYDGNSSNGGGIWIHSESGSASGVTMTGGTILGNKAGNGGGVYITENSSFDMTGGTIKNNVAASGGGIFCLGSFTNNGGSVAGNAPNELSHLHSFTYSASGAIITATCTKTDCPLTDNEATLTIVAPSLTYVGQTGTDISEAATLDGLEAFNAETGKSITTEKIKYVGRDGTTYAESDTAPTGAGKYTAKITVEEKTASVDYEIAKAATSITENPAAAEITYGQTLADSTLTGGTASVEGSFAWKDSTIAPAVSDSQTTEYDVVFTPTDENYGTAECKVKLTVNMAESAVTKAPTAKTLTYTGDPQELVNAGSTTGGEMQYALGTATEATQPYTTSIPSKTNAGTYYVWYKVVGDENHNDSEPASVAVAIAKGAETRVPKDIYVTDATGACKRDGSLRGVNDEMEYSTDDGKTWKKVAAGTTKIDNLSAGTVVLRYAGTDDTEPGQAFSLEVKVKAVQRSWWNWWGSCSNKPRVAELTPFAVDEPEPTPEPEPQPEPTPEPEPEPEPQPAQPAQPTWPSFWGWFIWPFGWR